MATAALTLISKFRVIQQLKTVLIYLLVDILPLFVFVSLYVIIS